MAIEKILSTRIILKNDELATLNGSSFIPKKGEAIYAKFTTLKTDPITNEKVPVPTYMHKIGDGENTFSKLNWTAALAADVYDWAKKENLDINDIPALSMDKITGLTEALNGKSDSNHNHDTTYKKIQTAVPEVGAVDSTLRISQDTQGKISVTAPKIQIAESQVTGLTDALAGKSPTGHKHVAADVTDFDNAVATKVNSMGIATSETVEALDERVEAVETAVNTTIPGSIAEKVDKTAYTLDKANLEQADAELDTAVKAAQADATAAKTAIEAFMKDADATTDAVDTLKEIQAELDADDEGAAAMLAEINKIKDGTTVVPKATDADTVDGKHAADFAEARHNHDNVYSKLGHTHTVSEITDYATDVAAKIKVETDAREDAVENLQGQIDTVKSTADSALQSITTTANGGLKVTNKSQIDIDTAVVFVFDCGSATVNIDN